MKRVLVVDDERRARRVLQIMLEQNGLESVAADSGEEALQLFQQERIDLVLTDLRMPGMSGLDLLRQLRSLDPELPVILMTAYGTVESAVEAMKLGAVDYILRPIDIGAVEAVVKRALELRTYRTENRFLKEQVRTAFDADQLAAAAPQMVEVADLVTKVAPTKSSVLITGETGTGKEVVARTLHRLSPRADKLFVPINCAAIPADLLESELFGHARGAFTGAQQERAGKFEVADGGTLFLDEIGDMPHGLQAKLLRVLQEGVIEPVGSNRRIPVDVRIVSSTNRNLQEAIQADRFRLDLFYRLNVFHIQLPPLRERREDIAALAPVFLERFARELGRPSPRFSESAIALLQRHEWPGNVRELRNLVERAAVLCSGDTVDAQFLQGLLPAPPPTHDDGDEPFELEPAVEKLERRLILRALGATADNKAQAAKLLGVSERTLWYKLKKFDL